MHVFADSVLTVRGERSKFFGPDARATRPLNGEYGVASELLDVKNEDSDFFFKSYLDQAELKASYDAGSQNARDLLTGYVAGYNRYLAAYVGALPAACRNAVWVRLISVEDMQLVIAEKAQHASGEIFGREIVAAGRSSGVPSTQRGSDLNPDPAFIDRALAAIGQGQLGSNGLVLGREVSGNGRGLLLANPHYP